MPERIVLDAPLFLLAGAPFAVALAIVTAFLLRRRGLPWGRIAALAGLRGAALLLLAFLLARPVALAREDPKERKTVALLIDRSRSMSLQEAGETRHARAVRLAWEKLIPALDARGLKVDPLVFADDTTALPPDRLAGTVPDGPRSNLGGAIARAVLTADPPPLAVVGLTDGAANESRDNNTALLALKDSYTPFIGVGFGDDEGIASLSLERVLAPAEAPPRQRFRISAYLQATGGGEIPELDLLLLRNGRLAQTKRIDASQAPRLWTEGFDVIEDEPGVHDYTVEVQPPSSGGLVLVSARSNVPVVIAEEREFRILFVQGALTWNFKFIGRALRGDPSVKLTGLSRTSEHSVFRQNVESAGELVDGFPDELSEIAPYRVVVLSDMKPSGLTPAQQEVIARFCGELGGGVLLLGGESTFDSSWRGSRLEQLLPVTFDYGATVSGLDRPFRLALTDEALRDPLFKITDDGASRQAWERIPTFSQYGRVLEAKPGAVIWARHSDDEGPQGRRILMAAQSYGAGVAAVVAVENVWRWRLAKDADPQQFDRFWRQLFRHLGQSGRQDVSIELADQELRPGTDVRLFVERRPRPEAAKAATGEGTYTVRVKAPGGKILLEQRTGLAPLRPVQIAFRAEDSGVYNVTVADGNKVQIASQPVEIKDVDREMERTGRDMENLQQWAGVSQGLALPEEDCRDADALVAQILDRIEELQRAKARPAPFGINGWVLALLAGCLCGDWALRRRWGLA